MTSITGFLYNKKAIFLILFAGTIFRLLFVFVGGEIYFGKADFFIQGDTQLWFNAFINLVEEGTFTTRTGFEAGKFFRAPGYSFFFGIFYLLTFKDVWLATRLLVAAQLIMDVASIYLVYKISGHVVRKVTEEKKQAFSNISALLYAVYPFAIVWTPVLYAETASIFFILLSVYYAFKPVSGRTVFASGMFAGIATLLRLQCAFSLPFIALGFLFPNSKSLKSGIKLFLFFGFGVLITYGLWPARNILLQDKVLFSQSLEGVGNVWSIDFLSFVDFSHSVSTDFIPAYKEILENKKVNWPEEAYIDHQDSILLDSAVQLCRTCGTGFSLWAVAENLREKPVKPSENCDTVIYKIFNSLYLKQKSENAFNYWINVPLRNLWKCFFKINLYGDKSNLLKWVSSSLFVLRSLLILAGLWGLFLAMRDHLLNRRFLFLVFGYMIAWYFYLSFFWRNVEMRFLLQVDVVLLIPAAYAISRMFVKGKRTATNV